MENRKISIHGFSFNSCYVCVILFLALQIHISFTHSESTDEDDASISVTVAPKITTLSGPTNSPEFKKVPGPLICTGSDPRPECKYLNRIVSGRGGPKTYEEIQNYLANLPKFDDYRNNWNSINGDEKKEETGNENHPENGRTKTFDEEMEEYLKNLAKFDNIFYKNSRNSITRGDEKRRQEELERENRENERRREREEREREYEDRRNRNLFPDDKPVGDPGGTKKISKSGRWVGIGIIILIVTAPILCVIIFCMKRHEGSRGSNRYPAIVPEGSIPPLGPHTQSGFLPIDHSTSLVGYQRVGNTIPVLELEPHRFLSSQSIDVELPTYNQCVPTAPPPEGETEWQMPSYFSRRIPGPT